MTLDKAIKTLQDVDRFKFSALLQFEIDALRLGIEALLAIKCGREGLRTEFHTPLLGETKD